MRCYSCNNNLTDAESTRRGAMSGAYLDLCNKCLKQTNIATNESFSDLDEQMSVTVYEDPDYHDWGHIVEEAIYFDTPEDEE